MLQCPSPRNLRPFAEFAMRRPQALPLLLSIAALTTSCFDQAGADADIAATVDTAPLFETTVTIEDTSRGPDLFGAEVAATGADTAKDAVLDTTAPADTGPAAGNLGFACTANADCNSGYCVPSPSGKVCSQLCVENCPVGYTCAQLTGTADATFMCLPRWLHVCDPCESDAACADSSPSGSAKCLSYGDEGKFCGSACGSDGECPQGFACVAEAGAKAGQCRKVSGICPCSPIAIEAKLATACSHSSPFGACKGLRGCGAGGLSACSAPIPKAETCNGQDDDCDAQTDNGIAVAPCVNSNALGVCAGQTACTAGKLQCVGETPAKETCNGKDDDCDGQVDESACDDGNPCTEDACNLSLGGCLFAQVTKPCNDGDVCSTDDTCVAGKCQGSAVNCDDGDGCTLDTCDAKAIKAGCQHGPNPGASCNDKDPCTGGDSCMPQGASLVCTGIALAEGASCSDGNPCTLKAACTSGKCKATDTACSDGNPCTDDSCDAGTGGACKYFYNIAACDDANTCTLGDACFAGKCVGLGKTNCDDQDPCTSDSCDAKQGGCVNTAKSGGSCTDGNLCTTGDACAVVNGKAVCTGTGLKCDDGKPCTSDACNPAFGCEYVFVAGPCDDGDKCTANDLCQAGQCTPGEYVCGECKINADCKAKEDGNLCNGTLVCEKQGHTCVVDPSTIVTCAAPGGGAGVCLKSVCDAKTAKCGFSSANDGQNCDDSNACTAKDICKTGACVGTYGTLACDDANPCTQDFCDPTAGCKTLALDGVGCVDGNSCTQNDTCADGKCAAGLPLGCDDGNPCSTDGCDASKGCIHNVNTLPCDDGNVCTTGDVCLNAVCTPKAALDCDDSNICTADSCNAKTGCDHTPANGIQCNDGNACTAADKCTTGQCVGGGQLPCSDGNVCTNDGCDPKSGCTFTPNTVPCNDGNACTDSDACQGGGCKSGKPSDCNDNNTCTVDLCDPAKGCIYQKVVDTTPCNDGDACTVSDKCSNAICLAGTKLGCNDSEPCTTDTCDVKVGCVYTPLPDKDPCTDSNICTLVDACLKGKCTGTGVKDGDKDGHIDSKCPGGDDCDDTSDKAYPGLKEVCDDLDNDCKAGVDDGCDDDNDDYCDTAFTIANGFTPKTCSKLGGDCDDTKAAINPGAVEKLELSLDMVTNNATSNNSVPVLLDAAAAANGTTWLAWTASNSWSSIGSNVFVAYHTAGSTPWVITVLPGLNYQTANFKMVMDSAGVPHIVTVDSVGNLIHAVWAPTGWTLEKAVPAASASYLAIGVFGSGATAVVHVTWWNSKTTQLDYARGSGGAWTTQTIDATGDVGRYASLAVDSKGAAWIAYLDYGKQDLLVANDSAKGGMFVVQTVDGATSAAGFHASCVVDAAGTVHVAYYELLGSDLRHAWRTGGNWTVETVDATGTVGLNTRAVAPADGSVQVSYLRADDGQRRIAAWVAGKWTLTDAAKSVSGAGALAASSNLLHICEVIGSSPYVACWWRPGTGAWTTSYADQGLGQWYVNAMREGGRKGEVVAGDVIALTRAEQYAPTWVTATRWLGNGLAFRTFANPNQVQPAGLTADPAGTVHACGKYSTGGFALLSGTWDTSFVTTVIDSGGSKGETCAVGVDKAGKIHVAFQDTANSIMRYATLVVGGTATVEVPDPSLGTGNCQDLVITPANEEVVAYGGATVRVASRLPGKPWVVESVAANPSDTVALAIDGAGIWHMLFNAPNGLNLRKKVGGVWQAPALVASTVGRVSAVTDATGALHAALVGGSYKIAYLTNRFGGLSLQALAGFGNISNAVTAPGITLAAGDRVTIAATVGQWPFGGSAVESFTYQNLVDDNCDGK